MPKRFLLTSENKAKQSAVKAVLEEVYTDVIVETMSVESGVSETPTTHDEGIQGALNRIENAKQHAPGFDGYIGLEGIIVRQSAGTFICGWAVVRTAEGETGYGCSAQVRLPDAVVKDLRPSDKLADKVAELYPDRAQQLPEIGTNGVLTDGKYTRVDEFCDALHCAIGEVMMQKV